MAKDLTILYSSAHKIPEKFAKNVLDQLYRAAGDFPVVELHSTPDKSSIMNYYRELLEAAKKIETPFVSFAEDDTLYPAEHFHYRPPLDAFAYNFNRWNLHTWAQPPFYSLRQRKILATLIAPRELYIEAMAERFAADPDGRNLQWWGEPGRRHHEKSLGITRRKIVEFRTYSPIVVFSHPDSFGYQSTGTKKRAGKIRALEIEPWGRAEDVLKLYYAI